MMRVLFLLLMAEFAMANSVDIKEYVAFSVLFFFVMLLTIISRKPVQNRNQKLIRTSDKRLAKLNLRFFNNRLENGDIIERLGLFFRVLHDKATQNQNTIIFNYPPRQARYFSANFKAITNATHNILCFVNKSIKNSSILFTIKPTKNPNEYQISIKTSAQMNTSEIISALEYKNRNINYKFLSIASSYAEQIGSKIEFSVKSNSSIFTFNATMHQLEEPQISEPNEQKSALVAYESQTGFFALVAGLSIFGIYIQPESSWESVKNHITDMLYKPDFLFIQAKIVKKLPYSELNLIKEWQEIKGFKIIIISDNSYFDDVASSFGDTKLYQPYTIDELASVIC